ncbi:MAG TPA: tRNA (adenosine(37)-N6)-threonylcarbamoyltransferase complex ATPase subunit type 1 TsaE [Bacillota bacterium]|nr:tRNA (adenosine(37)-N6)-threonylcarbamoyltransferase complex ATPase subunit type 1 TsaE [Bacillota bacterium]
MDKLTLKTTSEAETKKVAQQLAHLLRPGMTITLEGDLGVGKTTFAKGIAKGLGVKQTVTSPTFTIIKEYMGKKYPFYHIDAYRLEDSAEDIGFDEYFFNQGITVVEWAQFIEDFLPDEWLQITIHYIDDQTRQMDFVAQGNNFHLVIEQLNEQFKE